VTSAARVRRSDRKFERRRASIFLMDAVVGLAPPLVMLESVRCLECGEIYAKPAGGGTVLKNPGCPECSYVGWIPVTLPAEPEAPCRSVAGRRPLRFLPQR
jgi:phage FluMu protein Com